MKILHVIPTYAPAWQWGGPVRSVSDLCEGLASRGHDVTVFTTDAGLEGEARPPQSCEVLRNGVRVFYFPRVAGAGIASPELVNAARSRAREFALIHVTAIWQRTGAPVCAAARAAGVPYVISPRGALSPYSWSRGRLKKMLYYLWRERAAVRGAAGFHFTSAMEARELDGFCAGRPACVVPNTVDLGAWRRDEAAARRWRAAEGISPDERVFLYAGRFHHKKGLDLLPAVLERLGGERWRLVLVGVDDDGTGAAFQREMVWRGIGDRTRILPLRAPEELVGIYSAADAFLLPSRHENFGNAAVEAAACGCPVLASCFAGVAAELERLGGGKSLPREVEPWVAALQEVCAGQPLAEGTTEHIRQEFSRDIAAERMKAFYQSISA
jgi:glycosyltransferase involved in cell wall biosynthesis